MTIPTKQERQEFLEERRRGIGGSDIAAICGHHPYKSAMDVYLDKVRPVRPEETELEGQNIHIWRGLILEEPIRDLYEHLFDRPVQVFQSGNLKTHPDQGWVRVHLDGRQVSTGNHPFDTTGAWEAKAPSKQGFRKLVENGLERYRIMQIQWELYASGYEWGSVAIGNLEDDRGPLLKWDMRPHDELIDQMEERARRFWYEHVKPREEPDPEEWGEPARVEMPETEGERAVVEDPEMTRAAYRLMKAYLLRNKSKSLYEQRRDRFKELMEERGLEKAEIPGYGKVNFDWREGRTRFNDERLRKARPLDPDRAARLIIESTGADLDPDQLADTLIEHAELDYTQFETTSDAYRHFRPYVDYDDPSELPNPDNMERSDD